MPSFPPHKSLLELFLKGRLDKHWLSLDDSPEYVLRKETPFIAPDITISEIHAAIPARLWHKSTFWGMFYTARAVSSAYVLYRSTFLIPYAKAYIGGHCACLLWAVYWWCQGLVLAGWWCLAHEAGHGALTSYKWLNNMIGFLLHTSVLAPYFAWRESHRKHHKATMSVERDENYVPRTRKDYTINLSPSGESELEDGEQVGYLPPDSKSGTLDLHDIFSDAPFYNLAQMLVMQFLGWQIYLFCNKMGNPMYPPGTNHFSPSSPLFKPRHRRYIILSDIGLIVVILLLSLWAYHTSIVTVVKVYFIPYILCNHHIVLLTYLHHSDPTLPRYRTAQWTFVRGALSTCDRPLYGWIGRAILCNVSHDHVAHHLFSQIPFWNQPYVTECIKRVLREKGEFGAYNYDRTNAMRALYRTFTKCCFIEDEGDIVFYKNRNGLAGREFLDRA